MDEVVKVERLVKSFNGTPVLRGVSLSMAEREAVAIIGRSGSGKSTFLRCLNGLESVDSGEIRIAGHVLDRSPAKLRDLRKDVGIVFQSYNLFPHLTVLQNVTLAPRITKGTPKNEILELAREMLDKVGLLGRIDALPDQLSGGQQQRVAIARALAMQPKVMLFDEVTSALDPELTGEVLAVIKKLAADGMTMLLVTHEMEFARDVASRTIYLHEGQIHEDGPSRQIFSAPKTPELRSFLAAGRRADAAPW
jgi:polar amino acid transport system ATP-binding protein